MHNIGIVGAGTAGLHLALFLQQRGIEATIITDRKPEEYRDLPLVNTVAHHNATLQRETELGVNHWTDPSDHYFYHNHWFNFPDPLNFPGHFEKPSRAVDYRVYLPTLMQDFMARGGKIEYGRIEEDEIELLVNRFDLLVVAVGKGPLGAMFAVDAEESPFREPQRHISCGLYTGVRHADPKNVTLSITPGVGELIVIPTVTFDGVATALILENLPGSELENTVTTKYKSDPKAFLQTILDALERCHPAVYDRVDTAGFDLAQPVDLVQGGVLPTVRRTEVEFDNGKFAVAVGDVHATLDPVQGQGANVASYAAFVMGEEIVEAQSQNRPLDREFVESVNRKRRNRVLGASRWTNLMLSPPSEAMQEFIGAMSVNPALCNEFTDNFNAPEANWENMSSPENIRAWINRSSSTAVPGL